VSRRQEETSKGANNVTDGLARNKKRMYSVVCMWACGVREYPKPLIKESHYNNISCEGMLIVIRDYHGVRFEK